MIPEPRVDLEDVRRDYGQPIPLCAECGQEHVVLDEGLHAVLCLCEKCGTERAYMRDFDQRILDLCDELAWHRAHGGTYLLTAKLPRKERPGLVIEDTEPGECPGSVG